MRVPDPRYSTRYPRQGDVALLCEGDVAGFEVDLLEKWTIQRTGIFIDVWPCGTKSSFFGVSDAIGRSRPIAVLEDRDFQTAVQASKACEQLAEKRRDREVEVKFWRAWRRNEIENYLIEPDVLSPVLAARFDISVADVSQRLQQVISVFGIDQAAQKAIYRFRSLVSGYHPVATSVDCRERLTDRRSSLRTLRLLPMKSLLLNFRMNSMRKSRSWRKIPRASTKEWTRFCKSLRPTSKPGVISPCRAASGARIGLERISFRSCADGSRLIRGGSVPRENATSSIGAISLLKMRADENARF